MLTWNPAPLVRVNATHSGATICDHLRKLSIMRAYCETFPLASAHRIGFKGFHVLPPLTNLLFNDAREPDKIIVDTRGRCVAFGDGFNEDRRASSCMSVGVAPFEWNRYNVSGRFQARNSSAG